MGYTDPWQRRLSFLTLSTASSWVHSSPGSHRSSHPGNLFNLKEEEKRFAQCSEPHPLPPKAAVPPTAHGRKCSSFLPSCRVFSPAVMRIPHIAWALPSLTPKDAVPLNPLRLVTGGCGCGSQPSRSTNSSPKVCIFGWSQSLILLHVKPRTAIQECWCLKGS